MKKIYFIVFILIFSTYSQSQLKLSYNSSNVFEENRLTDYTFNFDSVKSINQKSPVLACMLSVFLPGLGQIYNGEIIKGFLFAGGVVIGSALLVASGGDFEHESTTSGSLFYTGIIIAGASYIWSIIDAPVSASRINKERRLSLLGKEFKFRTSFTRDGINFHTKFYFN